MPDWRFDADSIIDACFNDELMEELGSVLLHQIVVATLRAVKKAPRRERAYLIDGELVYFTRTGAIANTVRAPALYVTYTLTADFVIEPLWVFRSSEVSEGASALPWPPVGGAIREHSDAPLPEPVRQRLARALRTSRRGKKPH